MNERIKKLRFELGQTQQEFADKLGLKRQTIAAYEIGKIIPSESTLLLICEKFGVNREWLKTGNGDMLISKDEKFSEIISELEESDDEFIKNFITVYMSLDPMSKAALRKIAKSMAEKYKKQG